jgi:hypothetical protein
LLHAARAMAAADAQVALWSVRPPDLALSSTKFGKKQVCAAANAVGMSGVIQKHSAATGEFWAVLHADAPGNFGVLLKKLRTRGYTAAEKPRADVPESLLGLLETKPVQVLPSEDGIHSRGSSGALDRNEIPLTADEEDRLTLSSAFNDAAEQASRALQQLQRAEVAAAMSAKEAKEARAEAKEEREKAERERAVAAQEAKSERERERAALVQAAKEEREKAEREREKAEREREKAEHERAALEKEIHLAKERAARAEALLEGRRCILV